MNLNPEIDIKKIIPAVFSWGRILSMLHVRPMIGGLEISDVALRYVCWDGKRWYLTVLRLPTGILESGKIKDPIQFRQALRQLKAQINAMQGGGRMLDVAVSLSSVSIYSQVFTLPMIREDNLEKAIQLNIQMVSPKKDSENYSGWQLVGEDQNSVRLEILSSFIEKGLVDGMVQALKESGFDPHSVESRASSFARVIRELGVGFNIEKSYLALSVDGSGMEFVVIRKGNIYFQYFLPWQNIYGEERQISQEKFSAEVIRSVHQVMNFYNAHWSEPLSGLYVAATGLEDSLMNIIQSNFSMRVMSLELNFPQKISPAWFVALGTGLRGIVSPRDDKEISLLGISAQEDFRRGLLLRFLEFWRVLVPITLGILLLVFIGGDIFLRQTYASIEKNNKYLNLNVGQSQEVDKLQKQVTEFNNSVSMAATVVASIQPRFEAAKTIKLLMDESRIDLVKMNFPGYNLKVDVDAEAPTYDDLMGFASKLEDNPRFKEVQLPAQSARLNSEKGNWSFVISFKISPKTN